MAQQTEKTPNDLDFILKDIGGTFSKFQIFNYLLFAVPIFLSDAFVLDYVFSTLDVDYRCRVPECDTSPTADYRTFWLENAVPFDKSKPMRCMRYEPLSHFQSNAGVDACERAAFNHSSIVSCASGEFVYRTDEVSIVNEFNITCDDANWKLSLVGVVNNVARFIFMPLLGLLSDRVGRVPVLILCAFGASAFKFISSFSTSYEVFLIFTFLDASLSAGIYPTASILAMEWAITEKRILVSSIVMGAYPLGEVFTAFVAAQMHHFKWVLRIISLPGLLVISYIWLANESLRWLLVKKKYDRVMSTIKRAVNINNYPASQRTYDIVANKCKSIDGNGTADTVTKPKSQLKLVFTSNEFFMRLVICVFAWITCIFISYGTGVVSVTLPGDKYWNFGIVSAFQLPTAVSSYFMLTYMKRRWTLCISIIASGVTIIISYYFQHLPAMSLLMFFVGKFFIRHSVMVLYVYTGELWPTNLRHTIMGICSMFGRIGSIMAPTVPLMAQYSEALPFYLFFGMAVLSGVLILFTPETFETNLPDTIEEAKTIGTTKTNR